MINFKVGDIVEFTNVRDNRVDNFTPDYMPSDLIRHGQTILHEDYKREGGKILWIGNGYACVRTKMCNDKYLQLAYSLSVLKLKGIFDWKEILEEQ